MKCMPVISRFYGIVIKMYFKQKEHNPPHIHAIYGEHVGLFSLLDGEMFEGDVPLKEQRLVQKFIKNLRFLDNMEKSELSKFLTGLVLKIQTTFKDDYNSLITSRESPVP